MRKLVFTFLAVVGLSLVSMAQESTNTALSVDKTELMESKESGEYVFTFPATVTSEQIEKNANNYKDQFSVTHDATTNQVTMVLVENTPMNRNIMTRMLMSCGVHFVKVDGVDLNMNEFRVTYL
jgi:hypothetical protein